MRPLPFVGRFLREGTREIGAQGNGRLGAGAVEPGVEAGDAGLKAQRYKRRGGVWRERH